MKSGRKIVLFDPNTRGGVCHYSFHLAETLADQGVDVTLITGEDNELAHLPRHFQMIFLFKRSWVKAAADYLTNKKSAPVTGAARTGARSGSVKNQGFFYGARRWITLSKCLALFLWRRFEAVHFQWLGERETDYRFIRLLQWLGFKVVYTAHNVLPHNDQSAPTKLFFHKLYRTVDRIIVHAESLKREMLEQFALDAEKIEVVAHGAYDLFCGREGISKAASRERLGIGEDKKVLLFFGILRRNKGLDILLDAFETFSGRMQDAVLLVAGGGGRRSPAEYYEKLIRRLRENPRIKFVQQYIPTEEMELYFAAADVVVLPYRKASQSGVLLAAYGFGRAVVVTRTGGLAEAVEDGKSGLIVPPEDPAALAGVLQKVLRDPEKLESMAQYAKLLGQTKYSWTAAAAGTIELYRSLASPAGSRPVTRAAK